MDIEKNKQEFIQLVRSINREGFECEKLLFKLEQSDFFNAPASTIYHMNVPGGLVAHTLNVYNNLCALNHSCNLGFPEDSVKIVALFHDLSKMNYYESYNKNVKKYSEHGKSSDGGGRFDWTVEKCYKVREPRDRYIFGTHGQNSERMLSYFLPLSEQESAAIIWHHAGMDNGCADKDLTPIMNKFPLATALHCADLISCYINERVE